MTNPNGQRKEADREWFALKKALGLKPQSLQGDLCLSVSQTRLMADAKYRHKVLEIGCAGGELTLALSLDGCDVVGIDHSPAAIEHCKTHCDGAFAMFYEQCDDPSTYHGSNYDAVVINGYLDICEDPEPPLKAAFSRVAEDGELIVACGKNRFPQMHLKRLVSSLEGRWPFHIDEDEHYWYLTVRKVTINERYLFVTSGAEQAVQCNECAWEKRYKSGIWTWTRAFNGEAKYMEEIQDVDDYDIIHVQISGAMLDYPRRLKEIMRPDQKLVVNPDYSLDLWGGFMRYPDLLWHQMDFADSLFAVEPYTARFMESVLGRPVSCITHPVNVEYLQRFKMPREVRQDAMVIAHQDMRGHLGYYHYDHVDIPIHYSGPNPQGAAKTVSLYDQIFDHHYDFVSGTDMVKMMACKKVCTDAYSYAVSGRVASELASLGVPSIGYPNVTIQADCFPLTTHEEMDLVSIRQTVSRLLEDGIFYDEVASYAQEKIKDYGLNESKTRFLSMLEEDHGSRRNDPRLGVPEGTKAHGPEAGCGVECEAPTMGSDTDDGLPWDDDAIQSPSHDDSERQRDISSSRCANAEALEAV